MDWLELFLAYAVIPALLLAGMWWLFDIVSAVQP